MNASSSVFISSLFMIPTQLTRSGSGVHSSKLLLFHIVSFFFSEVHDSCSNLDRVHSHGDYWNWSKKKTGIRTGCEKISDA